MNRFIEVSVMCLLAFSSILPMSPSQTSRPTGRHNKSVSLETLLFSQDVPGMHVGVLPTIGATLDTYHGLRFRRGIFLVSVAEAHFKLANKYDSLSGTAYALDHNCQNALLFVDDASDPSQPQTMAQWSIAPGAQQNFNLSVHGVSRLDLRLEDSSACSNNTEVVVVASVDTGTPVQPASSAVVARYPANNAGVASDSKVLFGWDSFPGASNYLFHIWILQRDSSSNITAHTPLTFAATVYHSTTYIWNDVGFPTGTYQYALLPLDARGNVLAAWSKPTTIMIIN